jgi:DNA-binding GntR family transcriptional regulator
MARPGGVQPQDTGRTLQDPTEAMTHIVLGRNSEPLIHTKGQAAYLQIRSRILGGELRPGSIFNQEMIAAELGLSTTPVREALQRLQAEGLVLLRAHRDVSVVPLTKREITELNAVRLQLDPYAGRLAAQHASERDLELAAASVPSPGIQDPHLRVGENRRFHRAIYVASGNQLLTETLDALWDRSDRYRLILHPEEDPGSESGADHAAIGAALRRREGRLVAQLLAEHINAAQQLLIHRLADEG